MKITASRNLNDNLSLIKGAMH